MAATIRGEVFSSSPHHIQGNYNDLLSSAEDSQPLVFNVAYQQPSSFVAIISIIFEL